MIGVLQLLRGTPSAVGINVIRSLSTQGASAIAAVVPESSVGRSSQQYPLCIQDACRSSPRSQPPSSSHVSPTAWSPPPRHSTRAHGQFDRSSPARSAGGRSHLLSSSLTLAAAASKRAKDSWVSMDVQHVLHLSTVSASSPESTSTPGAVAATTATAEAASAGPITDLPQASPLSKEQQELGSFLASTPPRNLEFDRGLDEPPPSLRGGLGMALLKVMGFYSHKSRLLHGGQRLYVALQEQVDSHALHRAFSLDPSAFFSTYALMAVHLWLVLQRLAAAVKAGHVTERDAKFFRQRFYMQFNSDVGLRVHRAGVEVGATKWMKKLEQMFFSMSMSLDKALRGEGPESVVDVLLIEIYGGDTSYRPQATLLAQYLQRELASLELTRSEALVQGHIRFSIEPFRAFSDGKRAVKEPLLV